VTKRPDREPLEIQTRVPFRRDILPDKYTWLGVLFPKSSFRLRVSGELQRVSADEGNEDKSR
jgi:hypothetical protein